MKASVEQFWPALEKEGFVTSDMPMRGNGLRYPSAPPSSNKLETKPSPVIVSQSLNYLKGQERATRTILKFCRDHPGLTQFAVALEMCLHALEARDIEKAYSIFERFWIARMGSFLDSYPRAAFSHETDDYAEGVFQALKQNWRYWMKMSLVELPSSVKPSEFTDSPASE